ncbi:Protein CBG26272 [Caenorhabditis briggsae]|nr:Protein CBG26272 [Caenorhabditis briggsae]CAS00057.1 Protein CBG26272 [Caenorhabditis briggsae]
MSTTEEKNFGITHVFKNIDGLAKQNEMVGNVEKHFGAFW